ncbi:hypothetical protein OHB41_02880 [Streptomyces sp. NBC_01571]|uniref:hypothetical protein n=1 Tax=Streptomyces sp. NBC_01571 TaxID=2975883 RepID=UPI00225B213F|nr:hypothetical protein [Streptomyces sp. NBC_01571]MCX4572145.1 hypothetical protein [Streptomyces sp. NBC_01571]
MTQLLAGLTRNETMSAISVGSRGLAAEARLLTDLDDQDAEQLRSLLSRVAQTAQRGASAPGEADC